MYELKVPNGQFYRYNCYKSTGELIPKCRSQALRHKRNSIRSKINMLSKQIYQLKYQTQYESYQLQQLSNKANIFIHQAALNIQNIQHQQINLQQNQTNIQQQYTHNKTEQLSYPKPILIIESLSLQHKPKGDIFFQNSDRSTEIQFQMGKSQLFLAKQPIEKKMNDQAETNQTTCDEKSLDKSLQIYQEYNKEKSKSLTHIIKRKNSIRQPPIIYNKITSQTSANFMLNSLLSIIVLSIILMIIN